MFVQLILPLDMVHLSYAVMPGRKENIPADFVENGGAFPPKGENVCTN